MAFQKPLLLAASLLAVALAGCSESGPSGGDHGFIIKSEPSDPVTEPFVFEATVGGDSYEWEMGDGRPKQTGKTVEYVYGFTDGEVRPRLTVVNGGEKTTYQARTITLGTGQNSAPDLVMALEWDWVTVGEQVTFTGAQSSDPDGDPLLFSWFCVRQSGIGPAGGGHAHGGGGIQYGASGPDPVPSLVINGTDVPAADIDLGDDLCANMGAQAGSMSESATVTGSFNQPGIYKITMLAKDPKTPSQPGSRLVYVTETDQPRVTGPVTLDIEGDFQFGVPAALDAAMEQAGNQDHISNHPFVVQYPLVAFAMDFEYDSGAADENLVTWQLFKPNGSPKDTAERSDDLDEDVDYLSVNTSPHNLRVYGRQGQDLSYSATITLTYETDPNNLFEDPAGH